MHPGQRLPCAPPPTFRGGGGITIPLGREEDEVVEAAAAEGVDEAATMDDGLGEAAAAVEEGQRKPPQRWASTRRSGCSHA